MEHTTGTPLYIITGASRGLGLALAQQLLAAGATLLTIARNESPILAAQAHGAPGALTQWRADLADTAPVGPRLQGWLQSLEPRASTSVTLINNAGMIPALVPLRDADAAGLTQALRVGLEAAMILTACFLNATREWDCPRRVLNISSGLGRRPMASQAPYCAAKAGMDLFTRCVALEEATQPNGARVCALAPGVVDTDMQAQLRTADAQAFPDRGRFHQLHEHGRLVSPERTAERILRFLHSPAFGTEPLADIRDVAG